MRFVLIKSATTGAFWTLGQAHAVATVWLRLGAEPSECAQHGAVPTLIASALRFLLRSFERTNGSSFWANAFWPMRTRPCSSMLTSLTQKTDGGSSQLPNGHMLFTTFCMSLSPNATSKSSM